MYKMERKRERERERERERQREKRANMSQRKKNELGKSAIKKESESIRGKRVIDCIINTPHLLRLPNEHFLTIHPCITQQFLCLSPLVTLSNEQAVNASCLSSSSLSFTWSTANSLIFAHLTPFALETCMRAVWWKEVREFRKKCSRGSAHLPIIGHVC